LLRLESRLVFHAVSYASFASPRRANLDGSPEPDARPAAAGEAEKRLRLVLPLERDSYRSFGHFAIGLEWVWPPGCALPDSRSRAPFPVRAGPRPESRDAGSPAREGSPLTRSRPLQRFISATRRVYQDAQPLAVRAPKTRSHSPLHWASASTPASVQVMGRASARGSARKRAQPRPSRRIPLERCVAKRPQRSTGGEVLRCPRWIIPRWVAWSSARGASDHSTARGLFSPAGRAEVFSSRSALSHRFRAGRGVDWQSYGADSPIRATRTRGRRARS
jgi:hypothetical protein